MKTCMRAIRLAIAAAALGGGVTAIAADARARSVCKIFDVFREAGECQRRCKEIMDTPPAERVARWWWTSFYPHEVTETPSQITSCKVTPSPEFAGACRMTFCGPVATSTPSERRRRSLRVEQPVPKPRIGPPRPGLLESLSPDFPRQPPAPTGHPPPPPTRGSAPIR